MLASISTSTESTVDSAFDAIGFYENQISIDETCASHYWNLGIAYLLADREDDAQLAWFTPLSATDEIDNLTNELVLALDQKAESLAQLSHLEQAWLLRQHIIAIAPDRLENILKSIVLAHSIDRLTPECLIQWQVNDLLSATDNLDDFPEELLDGCLRGLISLQTDVSLEAIKLVLSLVKENREPLIYRTTNTAFNLFHREKIWAFAIKLAEICNEIDPNNLGTIAILSGLYCLEGLYDRAIATAKEYDRISSGVFQKLFASYLIQRAYFTAGNWENAAELVDLHRGILLEITEKYSQKSSEVQVQRLLVSSFFFPYIEDNPKINKSLQNKIANIYQNNIGLVCLKSEFDLSLQKKVGCLRIGYIASTLKTHSVGWLSRWLIHHHDRKSFQTFIYCLNLSKEDEFNHKWFRDKVDISYYFSNHPQEVAAQIKADEIDILIDLDSLTFDLTGLVMAYKPAPVQVSWLGWDASGIPAIDYFIADPYVLPNDAQEYYQEKIWRLPQTYLAVDGFEIGIPTLRRQDLNIPDDAVIYFSSQSGYKRHPDNIRCQMRIIKSVPNSYFLIKGKSDPSVIQNFFGKIAEEEGISLDRLRFLDGVPDEPTHRANLAIADIVLDTFPYNGATTTLETLWMGIPMVTQVGQQFAARNSYTFMLNAGITEGIAWNQQEYIEWGVKLGLDRDLRDKIAGKLRSGRTTAPVWNAKQFTLDMEAAYRQMWAIHQEQKKPEVIEDYSNN
ncbi:O-linked N-acetylglucosamine transferase, SPINDLY family protein [Chamaesiphon sp.]|uniref:O-linked N-acetylglucosamine transferase, SPINDLY family protein n=1 Tax=Chamaesiphon sp. TaxID=2814140 RepID=UPI00359397D3